MDRHQQIKALIERNPNLVANMLVAWETENEIEAKKRSRTGDFLPSGGAACCVSLAEYRASAKSKRKARPLFDHLLILGRRGVRPLPAERKTRNMLGCTALEWLVANESQGKDLSTRHPLMVEKVIIGRSIKGLTKDMWIQDLRDGLITPAEVREWAYSVADAQDVINRARSSHNAEWRQPEGEKNA